MRNRILVGLVGAGLVAALGAQGCGGGGVTATGTGTGGTGTTASSAHASSSTTGVTTGTGGTGGAGEGHSFATATPIDFATAASGDLSPTGAVDYYTFEGAAGDAIGVFIQAQGSAAPGAFDATTIDTVVTLFDSNKKQIAENNDAIPRRSNDSELWSILPADGTYYLRVEECWTWASDPSTACAGKVDKDTTSYSLSVAKIDPTTKANVKDAETGNDAASATPFTYSKSSTGTYFLDVVYGTYKDATDIDVFSFTVPADAVTLSAGARGVVSFWPLPSGTNADGSTTPVGKIYVTDTVDPTKHLAEISGTDFQTSGTARLWPALDLTKPYLLWVERPAGAAGANDFYFVLNGQGSSNPVETSEAANDVITTPEVPADAPDMNGGHHYYIDGDLINGAMDVDHWQVPVGTSAQIAVSCAAQRGGSGVRGFTIDVLDAGNDGGAPTKVGTIMESATTDAYLPYMAVPAAASHLVVKLSATSQDPVVTSSFYHCGIHLK
jgi:hypothetical protein